MQNDTHEAKLPSPFFVITNGDGDIVASEADGHSCALAYTSKELAELYIEQSGGNRLEVTAIFDHERRDFVNRLRESAVPFLCLNPTFRPSTFVLLPVDAIPMERCE